MSKRNTSATPQMPLLSREPLDSGVLPASNANGLL